ncbi:MAG: peptidyl-prolyl cis-trans isomerase [Alphaproteobacteria bacterium]
MNKFLGLSVAVLLATTSLASAQNAAVVNGEKITIEQLKEAYNDNTQVKEQVSFEDFYPKALEVFVNGTVLLQDAKKNGIENDATYKKQLAAAKDELARKIYLEKVVTPKVTDKEVDALYEEYKKSFTSQPEIKAKHILVADEATAKEVIVKINKGGDFVALAKEYSKEPADLGYFTKQMMVPEFGEAAFAMKKGEISKTPVKSQFGYHVIKVEDVRNSKLAAKKDLEPKLKALATQKAIADKFKNLYETSTVELFDVKGNPIKKK